MVNYETITSPEHIILWSSLPSDTITMGTIHIKTALAIMMKILNTSTEIIIQNVMKMKKTKREILFRK